MESLARQKGIPTTALIVGRRCKDSGSPGEELWGHYNAINEQQVQNSASNITPEKLGHYLHKTGSPVIRKGRAERQRHLCLIELVEEGDRDHDHVLSFPEFRHL